MLGGHACNGENDLPVLEILVEVDPRLLEEPEPGDIKILQIITMPYDLQWIQIIKWHPQLYLETHVHSFSGFLTIHI